MDRQNVIRWLDSYVKLKGERDGILAQIAELEEDRSASQLRSPQLSGMPHAGKISDPTAESAQRFAALMDRYEASAAELYGRMSEIEAAIKEVPNPDQRYMLRAHYLRGLEWEAVAKEKSYSVSGCTTLARKGISYICESVYAIVSEPEV